MRQISRRMEMIHPTIGQDGMSTGLTNTHTARGSLENNGFSLLYYIMVALHSSMLHRDSRFFLPLEQSRTALLDCRLDFCPYLKANRPNHFLFLLKVLLPSKFIAKSISGLLKRPLKQPGQV